MPRSKQALSRRLQVPAPTKKLAQGQDSSVRTSEKKRVHVSWSITSGARNGRLGAHARQASVNEPSGARLFSARSWRAARPEACQPVFSCQSWRTNGLKAPRLEIFVQRPPHVERNMSSELCRRSTLRVCSGVSVTAVSISAKTSLVRRRFSGRDWSGAPRRRCLLFVLMLSSDQSGRNARISRAFRPSSSHWRS